MSYKHRILCSILGAFMAGVWAAPAPAAESKSPSPGVGHGETSQQKSQQGVGLEGGGGSSGVIMGGPEIIIGKIASVQGQEYTINGNNGQFVKIHVTKDTNIICGGGAAGHDTKFTTGQQGDQEKHEIPISPATEQQMKQASKSDHERGALNDPNKQQAEHQMPPVTKDPSKLKDVVGSTDEKANQDIARGSGFVVGGSSGCQFKAGDFVRVEASDMGTATTIKGLSPQDPQIAGHADELQR